jgi:5-formyltetrahydrofolate cyclo-ligase
MTSSAPNPLFSQDPSADKSLIRARVWSQLRQVAIPDSRFHHDYSSFIADFHGSSAATNLLISLPCYKAAPIVFIAPDNCLQELRFRALQDGKKVLVTSYGIRRGFWLLDPRAIDGGKYEVASLLDGMERYGQHISLSLLKSQLQNQNQHIPFMATGTGAISSRSGLRFGKGHGFFDLEWAMLYEIGVVDGKTQTVAVVHECQVLDEELVGEEWDTGCDFVVTNERVIEVEGAQKPKCGILWEKLEQGMEGMIEPLRELRWLSGLEWKAA